MKVYYNLILILLIIFQVTPSTASRLDEYDREDKVTIIGGGPAGSYAAWLLKEKGYESVVIEAADEIGGKCCSFSYKGQDYDHGAIQLPPYYKRVWERVKAYNLTPIESPSIYFSNNRSINEEIRKEYGLLPFFKAYMKYTYYAWKYNKVIDDPAYIESTPDLQQSVQEFIESKKLHPLKPIFDTILTAYGYGKLDTIPIHHGFSILPFTQMIKMSAGSVPFIGSYLSKPTALIEEGYQHLIQNLLQESQAETMLSTRIHTIEVLAEGGAVLHTDKDERILARKLILTLPINQINVIYPTAEENRRMNDLKNALEYSPYSTTIFKTSTPLPQSLRVMKDSQPLDPVMIGQKFETKNVYISYAYGDQEDSEQIGQSLKNYLEIQYGIEEMKVLSHRVFPTYYPHPSLQAIKNGFYSEFQSFQGNRDIYFSLPSFEIVERAFQSAEKIVQTYF